MDADHEEDRGKSAILPTPRPCICPAVLQRTADAQGVTCQCVFERAFARAGYEESFARAVFVMYVSLENRELREAFLPRTVVDYAARAGELDDGSKRARTGFCVGCQVNKKAWLGIVFSYQLIHPEVTRPVLVHLARVALPDQMGSEVDRLFQDLLESGALEEPENWEELKYA